MDDAPALKTRICPLTGDPRPYHHGDLRRALLEAAERVLEREGPQALSLRAVAREAGVSPAAPYHHFKDKNELVNALGDAGFAFLAQALKEEFCRNPDFGLTNVGAAYVRFARANPALYRVMYDCARNADAMPGGKEDGGFGIVKQALIKAGADPEDVLGLELTCVSAWCAAHGVAEMVGFVQFQGLVEACGSEDAFIRAVFDHLGLENHRKA